MRISKLCYQIVGIIIVQLVYIYLASRIGWAWDTEMGWFTIFLVGFITAKIIGDFL